MRKRLADWHRADIKAALEKAGWSTRQIAMNHGVSETAVRNVHKVPSQKWERVIADLIGVQPWVIWPTRYTAEGVPNRRMGRPPVRPLNVRSHAKQDKPTAARGNTQAEAAA